VHLSYNFALLDCRWQDSVSAVAQGATTPSQSVGRPAVVGCIVQIGYLIRRSALYFGERPCLTEGERRLSYRDFDRVTDRVGNTLLRRGLRPGERVGVLLPNGIDCLVAYYALAKAGLVRVTLNTRETEKDHVYKLEDSGARAVISSTEDALPVDTIGMQELREAMESGPADRCAVDRPLDSPYRLGYTGGTTGRPKAVVLTMRGELAELSAFLMDLVPDLGPQSIFLHAAPIAHASGAFFLPSLARGAQSVIMPKFDPGEFVALAERTGASHTFLVPTMLAMILAAPQARTYENRLRRIAYGASPIAPSVLRRGEERFGRIFAQTYGQAESPMVITHLAPEDHDRTGSCGLPYTFVEVGIVDAQERFLAPGEIGEIVCRGPQLMQGYWNRPEETAKALRGGWLHTGDLGRVDDDGFFYIVDRKNDMLISGGFNVYPREVEDVLLAYDGVVEAAVVGIPDEIWGDRVHAVVAGPPGLDAQAVLEFAAARLASYKRPKSLEVWRELPKSGANKILRREIRERVIAFLSTARTVRVT
jgi:acyl-CoA synthetase (AMP-forming)/AMP-acid ligase II